MKKKGELAFAFEVLAEWTGLEPATPGVTGRYSNRLNYHSMYRMFASFFADVRVFRHLQSPRILVV